MKTPRLPQRALFKGETWLETEEFCYSGATRRARVRMPDGTLKILRCRLADTYFSIPVGRQGYIGLGNDELQFNQYANG